MDGIFFSVLEQVGVMLLLMGVGAFLTWKEVIGEKSVHDFSGVLLKVISPSVIINAFLQSADISKLPGLGFAAGLAVVTHIIAVVITTLVFRKKGEFSAIRRFAASYSNCGFMAIPLITALFGEEGAFYASAFIIVFYLFVWTHGAMMMSGKISVRKMFLNPAVIALCIGLVTMFLPFRMPEIITKPIGMLAQINTVLAMLITGYFLAKNKPWRVLKDWSVWVVSFVKLVAIPGVMIPVYLLVMHLFPGEETLRICLVNLLAAACPTASLVTIFAANYHKDVGYASSATAVATVLSVLTLPAMAWLFELVI